MRQYTLYYLRRYRDRLTAAFSEIPCSWYTLYN